MKGTMVILHDNIILYKMIFLKQLSLCLITDI